MERLKQTLSLRLFNTKERPSFAYENNGIDITALFDSGATTPVWCMGEKKFIKAYPDAIKLEQRCMVSGFGKEAEDCSVYIIPLFKLNGGDEYCISRLQVAVCTRPQIGFDFVLSDTMFSKTNTIIKRVGVKMIEFDFEREVYQCLVLNKTSSFSVTTFSQEE